MTKRSSRSDTYQWRVLEIPVDMSPTSPATNWNSTESLYSIYSIEQEQIDILDALAHNRLSELVLGGKKTKGLTTRQKQIWQLLLQGMTQHEMAATLHCHQSTITKTIHGDQQKKNIYYGGIEAKLKNICLRDNQFRIIIQQLAEYNQGSCYYLARSWFKNQDDFDDWMETPIDEKYGLPEWMVEFIINELIEYKSRPHKMPTNKIGNVSHIVKQTNIHKIKTLTQNEIETIYEGNSFHIRRQVQIRLTTRTHKLCPHCNKTKPVDQFTNNRDCKDKKSIYCKDCVRTYNKRK
jgi:DNA-binding CsgD family transcriptional regulator